MACKYIDYPIKFKINNDEYLLKTSNSKLPTEAKKLKKQILSVS